MWGDQLVGLLVGGGKGRYEATGCNVSSVVSNLLSICEMSLSED